jgi:hypothetical protein
LRINAGLIGDYADVLALERGEILSFQHVDARLSGGCGRLCRILRLGMNTSAKAR